MASTSESGSWVLVLFVGFLGEGFLESLEAIKVSMKVVTRALPSWSLRFNMASCRACSSLQRFRNVRACVLKVKDRGEVSEKHSEVLGINPAFKACFLVYGC